MDSLFAAALGLLAYGKYLEYESRSEREHEERESAIEALRERAERLREVLEDMERDLRYDPHAHSEKQLRKAQRKADRADEALLLARAGVLQPLA